MIERPRILRIITRMNIGGPATHVQVADRGLRARGWETLLVFGAVEPDEAEVDLENLGLPLVRVPTLARPIRPLADLRSAARLARLIRAYRPHIIHTHLSKAGMLGRAVALATSRAARVHTFHGTIFGGYFGARASSLIVRAERLLGARTHAVIALSPQQRQELLAHAIAPASRIHIVPLGLPLERFASAQRDGEREAARIRLGVPMEGFVVLAVGRLVPIKGLERLVEAFAALARHRPEARLYMVGDGSERARLEAQVRAAGLESVVAFVGWSADTRDWYAAADVVALTSHREGTPLALIEAAAAGRPSVATNVGGVADVVVEGETGFMVAPDDIAGFAERLDRLAANPGLRAAMSTAAPRHAAGFAGDRLVDDLDRLYRGILHPHRMT